MTEDKNKVRQRAVKISKRHVDAFWISCPIPPNHGGTPTTLPPGVPFPWMQPAAAHQVLVDQRRVASSSLAPRFQTEKEKCV